MDITTIDYRVYVFSAYPNKEHATFEIKKFYCDDMVRSH